MKRALLSVSDKTGLADLARELAARGFDLVSTGGTARALQEARLQVISVSEVTGFPEMMDGRVKTLHPKVHGGILARRGRPDDLQAAAAHDITLIDLVVVNLYPFERTAARPGVSFDALVEDIDIGGPSLVRAAAKNFEDVLVVVSPDDYGAVVEQLDRPGGPDPGFRLELARRAFAHTARYDSAIAGALRTVTAGAAGFTRTAAPTLPDALPLDLCKVRDLRYGENPHQQAALYQGFGAEPAFRVLQGKELSYTNLLDLDSAARIVMEFSEPAAAIVKHTNPCGVSTGSGATEAYVRAREADALAAFGGIVGLNRPIDVETARAIVSTFIEAVVAPSVDEDARAVLATKASMRVVIGATAGDGARAAVEGLELRSIFGGVLVQARDVVREAHEEWPPADGIEVATRRPPSADEWRALRFAWRVCAHVKSNTVLFASADRTLAVGAGQMSRVDAVRVARMKAESLGPEALRGSVAASDAFFPFRDGIDAVAAAGATAVVQPGGSVRDREVIDAADEHGLAMVFTRRRHFRH